uniref:NADH-ubiquinone oxidoreductase chain 4L n=1 Tax=Pneumocystis carinii TaxID=4754 RepID=D2XDW3_PNECA|nr:NADH dehydrogenase subunit 4L [Pneumocystis carinii]ACZ82953.1 NADH dehydrogenase subunit 4L [Pneumocystis carinii]AFR90428.1 NADH dehydrogenase subunit 4L [Pneumocystis carinii]
MSLSLTLFVIGLLGFILHKKNVFLMLMCIEIMLLSITLLIILSSQSMDDILGQCFGIYIISIAGAESALGLGMIVSYHRLRESIIVEN